MRIVDNLNLLLPQSPAAFLEHARRVTTFLRLVRDEARAARAAAVGVGLDAARVALAEHLRDQARSAVTDLLRIHLYAELGPDSFAWFGEPAREAAECWSQLEGLRDELRNLPQIPAPNERALEVCRRLLEALEALGARERAVALWRARIEHAAGGPAAGEREYQPLLRPLHSAERVEAVCGLVECALDRGAVRSARRLLAEHAPSLRESARAVRLEVWCAVLSDDEAAARLAESVAPGVWVGRLPSALLELRAAAPHWLPYLSGREAPSQPHASAPSSVASGVAGGVSTILVGGVASASSNDPHASGGELGELRRSVGACAAAHVRLSSRQVLELVAFDVAPGLRDRLRHWKRALEQSEAHGGSLEHSAIVEARPMVAHRCAGAAPRDAIHTAQVHCVAVAPYLDGQGEVSGWLRLEWEHHLAPSRARLSVLSRGFAQRARATLCGEALARTDGDDTRSSVSVEWTAPAESVDGPSAAAFVALVDALGMKTAQRQWWGFEAGPRGLRAVAQGGGASADEGGAGGRRAVLRALRTGAMVRYDEPRHELSMRADSACGVVLPIRRHGALCGLLALESTRRRDFSEALAQRWLERAGEFALQLRIAQFREWHRAQRGADVFLGHGPQAWIEPFSLAARSNAHVALFGRHGVGKRVVARWLHFAGPAAEGELVELSGALPDEDSALLHSAATIVLEHVERLGPAQQRRLAEWLEPARRGAHAARAPRWIVSSRARLSDPTFDELVDPELRQRLGRLQLAVPDLAERRPEIAQLLHVLAQRVAHDEGLRAPTFEDDAIALLWRQPWPLNVRELENFVFKVVLMAPGESLRADDVERIARRFGVELARRVSSRAPEEALVRAALLSTMNLRGTVNKTRASLYLGWDPDTLVARMNDLGIDEHTVARAEPSNLRAEAPNTTAPATGDAAPG